MPSPEPGSAGHRLLKRLPGVELGLLILAALLALAFHARLPSRLPSEEDYRQAGEVLSREAQPGDVVMLHPWWTERARLFVPESVPVVSYLDDQGDPLVSHPRIWVLAQPDLPRAKNGRFEAAFSPHRTLLGAERHFGTLVLSLYRNDRYRPTLFAATDSLPSARVYLEEAGGQRTECPSDGRQFRCAAGPRVAAEWHELFYKPERCLWMHPPGGDARLVVEFPDVPPGRLRLEAGIAWESAWMHDPRFTPIAVSAQSAQSLQVLARIDIQPGMEGFLASDGTLPQPAPVRVWTQSRSEERRDACVQLRVLGPSAAEGP